MLFMTPRGGALAIDQGYAQGWFVASAAGTGLAAAGLSVTRFWFPARGTVGQQIEQVSH
jgi:hypothetical protein